MAGNTNANFITVDLAGLREAEDREHLRDRVDRMVAAMMAPVADPHERVVWWPWHLGDGDREAAARAALKCVRAVDAALAAEEVGRD